MQGSQPWTGYKIYPIYPQHHNIISTPKILELARKSEISHNFERVFLYQPSRKRRTPLPTHQNQKLIRHILSNK